MILGMYCWLNLSLLLQSQTHIRVYTARTTPKKFRSHHHIPLPHQSRKRRFHWIKRHPRTQTYSYSPFPHFFLQFNRSLLFDKSKPPTLRHHRQHLHIKYLHQNYKFNNPNPLFCQNQADWLISSAHNLIRYLNNLDNITICKTNY